jgi:hypothetical protein
VRKAGSWATLDDTLAHEDAERFFVKGTDLEAAEKLVSENRPGL